MEHFYKKTVKFNPLLVWEMYKRVISYKIILITGRKSFISMKERLLNIKVILHLI